MAKTSQRVKQQKGSKFKARNYNRCRKCGRSRAVYRKFGLCRICLRELAHAGEIPGVFHSVEPAWNDRNLRDLAAHVESPLVFAHIRASSGSPVQQTNCHPFRYGRWLCPTAHVSWLAAACVATRGLSLQG